MNRAAIALALALVAPITLAATTKPAGVTTTYTNAAGTTTSAEVLLRSETSAGAVVTRKVVTTPTSSLARMAKGAVTRGNAVGAAITLAVVGIGWYVDEATRQVMQVQKLEISGAADPSPSCYTVPLGKYVEGPNAYYTVQPNPNGLKVPWQIANNCTNLPFDPQTRLFPQFLVWNKTNGLPTAPPKIIPWDQVVATPGVPTANLPQTSIQDNAWPSEWPELQTAVTTVNNTVNNYYEGDKTNYDQDTINATSPASDVQMPTLNPWQPAIQPLTDLGGDIPKTNAPMSNMPSLPSVAGSGICRGFDVNIPPILVGTLNKHCYYIDNYIRPFLMWFFYMLTAGYLYETWKREVFKGIN